MHGGSGLVLRRASDGGVGLADHTRFVARALEAFVGSPCPNLADGVCHGLMGMALGVVGSPT